MKIYIYVSDIWGGCDSFGAEWKIMPQWPLSAFPHGLVTRNPAAFRLLLFPFTFPFLISFSFCPFSKKKKNFLFLFIFPSFFFLLLFLVIFIFLFFILCLFLIFIYLLSFFLLFCFFFPRTVILFWKVNDIVNLIGHFSAIMWVLKVMWLVRIPYGVSGGCLA